MKAISQHIHSCGKILSSFFYLSIFQLLKLLAGTKIRNSVYMLILFFFPTSSNISSRKFQAAIFFFLTSCTAPMQHVHKECSHWTKLCMAPSRGFTPLLALTGCLIIHGEGQRFMVWQMWLVGPIKTHLCHQTL